MPLDPEVEKRLKEALEDPETSYQIYQALAYRAIEDYDGSPERDTLIMEYAYNNPEDLDFYSQMKIKAAKVYRKMLSMLKSNVNMNIDIKEEEV